MKFFDAITKNTIRDKINRICGTTDATYSLRDKLADANDALDEYWFLAAESAPQGTFDDANKTSAPIETQDLADGTNAYKMSDFTNEVLSILRVSALTADGLEYDLPYQEFENTQDFLEEYSTDSDARGNPARWTRLGDYIYITPCPNYAETGGLRCYVNRELSKFAYITYVAENTGNTLDLTAHGLSDGDTVVLSTAGVMPNGWTADSTVYYVVNKNADDFQVALTDGGSAVTISSDGTGTQKFLQLSKTPGIPVIHHDFLVRYAAFQFLDQDHPKFGKIREMLAIDRRDIQDYWQSMIRPGKTVIRTKKRLYK